MSDVQNIHADAIARREKHIRHLREKIASYQEQLETEIEYLNALKKLVPKQVLLEESR